MINAKLHPKVKSKWTNALRSGKFDQSKKVLRNKKTKGMCCIGVLCHIYGATNEELDGNNILPFQEQFNINVLPKSCEVLSNRTSINKSSHWVILARMNDNGYSFNEIADYIEENH